MKRKKILKRKTGANEAKNSFFDLSNETKRDILGILLFALAIVSLLSFFGIAGDLGKIFFWNIRLLFGWGFLLLPIILTAMGIACIKAKETSFPKTALFGIIIFTLGLLGIFHLSQEPSQMKMLAEAGKGGGYLGILFAWPLVKFFGPFASFIILISIILISLLIIFNTSLRKLLRAFTSKVSKQNKSEEINSKSALIEKPQENLENKTSPLIESSLKEPSFANRIKGLAKRALKTPNFKIKSIPSVTEDEKQESIPNKSSLEIMEEAKEKAKITNEIIDKTWQAPPIDLLEAETDKPSSGDISANANIIKQTLENFGIEVEMGEVKVGPTVTQYTLRPEAGIKLSRITALQNDLALALAAHPLRIEAPIPGKALVGIEIPNKTVARVRLRNLLESSEFKGRRSNLTMILGRDVSGQIILANLEKMPHLLIAGATGSGKTVALNSLIISLLYQNSPKRLKFILIDPKRVEFTNYNGIPHLLTPVIVKAEKAVNALRWAIEEMEKRYELLSEKGARDIFSYNKKQRRLHSGDNPVESLVQDNNHNLTPQPSGTMEPSAETLPFIVIIIDELADLMSVFPREIEASIVRLAQMARAVGLHLVVSTQRPSVEVITGLIKANITSRIAFEVASQVDSRTILDTGGAEKLLGNGDMLYIASDISKPKRIQGAFVSEREVKKVAEYIKKERKPKYNEEIIKPSFEKEELFTENTVDDELYENAKEVVIASGKASASLLQRRLRVGYARAARLLDLLEERGIIGPPDGAKPREILTDDKENNI